MLPTLIMMTLLVGVFMGVIGHWSALHYFEERAIKRLDKAAALQRQKDQDDMDAACDLVNRELGATILTYQE